MTEYKYNILLGPFRVAVRLGLTDELRKGGSLLCITIDENQPQEYIGELDGYEIYVERLKTDALYYTSVKGNNIPLRDAVNKGIVSVKDRREKAWDIIYDGGTEILRYENYEIAISDGNCIIRPITE